MTTIRNFLCGVTGDPCTDTRCKRGDCFQERQEAAERRRLRVAEEEAEENEVRIEAERLVRAELKKRKNILYHSTRFVEEMARRPKNIAAARKVRAARRAK